MAEVHIDVLVKRPRRMQVIFELILDVFNSLNVCFIDLQRLPRASLFGVLKE